MTEKQFTVTAAAAGMRLDVFLTDVSGFSRGRVQRLLKEGAVTLSTGKAAKGNLRVAEGDVVSLAYEEPETFVLAAEDIPLSILYEDEEMIVLDKARGMVCHPAPGNMTGTLVQALLHHVGPSILDVGDAARPGIVHRLDKDTSGVMVAAKTARAYEALRKEIGTHEAVRHYLALVHGNLPADSGIIRLPLGRSPKDRMKWAVEPKTGKPAVTHFRVLEQFPHYSWLDCRLETGRTHQIRVHMAHIEHPVVNDPLYGYKKDHFPIAGQALHSHTLDLHHPVTGEKMHFEAPIPADLVACLEMARKGER